MALKRRVSFCSVWQFRPLTSRGQPDARNESVWEVLQQCCSIQVCVCVCAGKSQVMGEIKIALKKEVKTEGDHLVLEILQCRNITYKFKSPDHLPGNCRFTSSC